MKLDENLAMTPSLTLGTQIWERDWKQVLAEERMELFLARNPYPFTERVLMINNVKSASKVAKLAERAVQMGAISGYVFAEDYAEDALAFFGLSREDLGVGYWYSISELVLLHRCKTDYLAYILGDCMPMDDTDWIRPSLELMKNDPRVVACNPLWNGNAQEAKAESREETEDFFIGHGFSDQCFLAKVAQFREQIYGEEHPDSDRYPVYAGNSFERRVNSWMQNHGYLRGTFKHSSYLHQNWPLTPLEQFKRFPQRVYQRLLRDMKKLV